jgi:hypothetical protein
MSNSSSPFRASKLEDWEVEAAARLKALFDDRKDLTQKSFGLNFGIGTGGMVSQYLNAKRPISLHTAIKFARGLGVSVSDISPTLAAQLPKATGEGEMIPKTTSLHQASSSATPATLGQTLERLARYFEVMDASTRSIAISLLGQLADNPQDHARIAAMIELSIASKNPKRA